MVVLVPEFMPHCMCDQVALLKLTITFSLFFHDFSVFNLTLSVFDFNFFVLRIYL